MHFEADVEIMSVIFPVISHPTVSLHRKIQKQIGEIWRPATFSCSRMLQTHCSAIFSAMFTISVWTSNVVTSTVVLEKPLLSKSASTSARLLISLFVCVGGERERARESTRMCVLSPAEQQS